MYIETTSDISAVQSVKLVWTLSGLSWKVFRAQTPCL